MNRIEPRDVMIREMIEELVVYGIDDWVMMTQVDLVVKNGASRHGMEVSASDRISIGIHLLGCILEDDLMVPGEVLADPPGFVPWSISRSQAMQRIERDWRALEGQLRMGDVCWLANTDAGDALAEKVRDAVALRAGWPPQKS